MRRTIPLLFLIALRLYAQTPQIPIRQVQILASTDSGVVANVYVVRVMSDGRPLLNDAALRRLLLIDTSMKSFKIIADTAGKAKNNFGANLGGLLFFPGDSVAFVDRASQSLIMVYGTGEMGRVFSPPKVSDMAFFQYSGTANYGLPGFDANGRLYYRAALATQGVRADPSLRDSVIVGPDSAPIIRADLDRRTLDTIAYVRIPVPMSKLTPMGNGGFAIMSMQNPMPVMDDWAYFSDGTVAILRAIDYHLDWIMPDGSRRSTPKMPFDWRALPSDEKQRMVDSLQHMMDSSRTAAMERAALNAGRGGPAPAFPRSEVVPVKFIPDYFPPLRPGSQMRVDLDDHLWIMPSTSIQAKGGLLYDVVSREGKIIERVQLPAGRNLHGFAPGGIIYLSIPGVMNAQFGWPRLEKAKIIRP